MTLPTKPLLILRRLLSKSRRQSPARITRAAAVGALSPTASLQVLQQPQECPVLWGGGHSQPLPVAPLVCCHRAARRDTGDTRGPRGHSGTPGTLSDPWPALLTLQPAGTACLQREPSAKAARSANTPSTPCPCCEAGSRAGQGTRTRDSSSEVPVPFVTLPWRGGPQSRGRRGQSAGER